MMLIMGLIGGFLLGWLAHAIEAGDFSDGE